jgi:hypothetical protein
VALPRDLVTAILIQLERQGRHPASEKQGLFLCQLAFQRQ